MSWTTKPLVGFDTETTGAHPESARIVSASIAPLNHGGEQLTWLVDPGVEIPAGASAVHGITTDRARAEGRIAAEAIEEITAAIAGALAEGAPIVVFNARFDLTLLDREARRHGIRPLQDRVGGPDGMLVLDPLIIDKQVDRYRRGKRTLGATCEHYGVKLGAAHTAGADALAAAELAVRLGSLHPELADLEIGALHRQQVAWAAAQAESLEEFFTQNGHPEHVERAWPLIPSGDASATPTRHRRSLRALLGLGR